MSAEQAGPIINCHDIPAPRGISFNSETKKSHRFRSYGASNSTEKSHPPYQLQNPSR
ncbi:hypothetical protein C1H46_040738 [Malus baccata]|uniref:Uncharacterized protein n=1 Tax=Malus baccata TaxID=106549 RepID=A0A540KHQ4_MALBA|nr:hypothetical protein C1H46_040738 [Malus baccata]